MREERKHTELSPSEKETDVNVETGFLSEVPASTDVNVCTSSFCKIVDAGIDIGQNRLGFGGCRCEPRLCTVDKNGWMT